MLYKTRGIALNYIKYGDTSIIAKIYTEAFGLQSYIQNGVRSNKSKTKIALFQPLTLLDLVVYHKSGIDLHRISEIKVAVPYKHLHSEVKKITISSFLTEFLMKCLTEEMKNETLFQFLYSSFQYFDHIQNDHFHIIFLIKLSKYFGFHPITSKELIDQVNKDKRYINDTEILTNHIQQLLEADYDAEFSINSTIRGELIDVIVHYYQLHIDGFGEMKSLKVLREL